MSDAHVPASSRRECGVRLQKHLAACGFGSRRRCERMIAEGLVSVDGRIVREQGVRVDPERQRVRVEGRPAEVETSVYLLFHKPARVVCTARDPQGRPTVLDILPPLPARVFTAGRLDFDSEGLLLLTNDGGLVQRMMHPRHHVEKTYRVWIDRRLADRDERQLAEGIALDGAPRPVAGLRLVGRDADGWCYEVRLREGRNRQIRRLMGAVGNRVTRLLRTAIGPLRLGALPAGGWRRLSAAEVAALRRAAGRSPSAGGPAQDGPL